MTLALFDFDGTVTFKDSFTGFIKYMVGNKRFYLGLACLAPFFVGFLLGLIPAWRAKELMSIYFFGGLNAHELEELASKYSREELPKIVRKIALEQIEWHKQQGHTVVIISASLDLWLKYWCKAQNTDLIATMLEEKDGLISGRFLTKNCDGREKVRRIEARFNLSGFDCIYAYGDSPGDRPMLSIANKRYYNWKPL